MTCTRIVDHAVAIVVFVVATDLDMRRKNERVAIVTVPILRAVPVRHAVSVGVARTVHALTHRLVTAVDGAGGFVVAGPAGPGRHPSRASQRSSPSQNKSFWQGASSGAKTQRWIWHRKSRRCIPPVVALAFVQARSAEHRPIRLRIHGILRCAVAPLVETSLESKRTRRVAGTTTRELADDGEQPQCSTREDARERRVSQPITQSAHRVPFLLCGVDRLDT